NCILTRNSAYEGGGAAHSTLNNCALTGNSAYDQGGGAFSCTLNNCALTANSASGLGGGVAGGTLNNCTLTGNSAAAGGGVSYAVIYGDLNSNEARTVAKTSGFETLSRTLSETLVQNPANSTKLR